MKQHLSKLKSKMPPARSKADADEGQDPMFEIPEGEDFEDSNERSKSHDPDSGADLRTAARAKDGTLASEGDAEEGTPEHEAAEGPAEEAAEVEHGDEEESSEDSGASLDHVSDADLHAELARRMRKPGKPRKPSLPPLRGKSGDDSEGEYS